MAWSWLSTESRLSSDTAEAMNWKMFWYWLNVNVARSALASSRRRLAERF